MRHAVEDRTHEALPTEECRRLLGTGSVGRLAYTHGALPAILPVSYRLHDEEVLVAARRDDPVVDALRRAVVAFGVDSWDDDLGTGWSVTAVGPTRLITVPGQVRRLDALDPRAPGWFPERCYVAVRTQLLHGWRRLVPSGGGLVGPAPRDL